MRGRALVSMKFVDLFAGLGGFHVALQALGHECVSASEIDPALSELYERNFGLRPLGDLRLAWNSVPEHDILCAGFPCQPFSKAGTQQGFACPQSGDLFWYIAKIIKARRPRYIILENVPNIRKHRNGETLSEIRATLESLDYQVSIAEYSPHHFGVPQIRPRTIIVAAKSLLGFVWPKKQERETHISSVLEADPVESDVPGRHLQYLDCWAEFLALIPKETKLPSFPIWAMEFDADYPLGNKGPLAYSAGYISRFRGAFGNTLRTTSTQALASLLPPYARSVQGFPVWKKTFIKQNRQFFRENRRVLLPWIDKVREFHPSFQKFEWNAQGQARVLEDKVIQFRASGIRVRSANVAPSLVALTTSQIPIIGWQRRFMTATECARLQSLESLRYLPATKTATFRALGNAVNARVIESIAMALIAPEASNANVA